MYSLFVGMEFKLHFVVYSTRNLNFAPQTEYCYEISYRTHADADYCSGHTVRQQPVNANNKVKSQQNLS